MVNLYRNAKRATRNAYIVRITYYALLLVLLLTIPAYAALDLSDIGVGARPLGMGKAYLGVADDASAIFMNPAGLSQNDNLNVVSMSGAMMGDINYILFGVSDNSPLGKFGFGYINAAVASIPLTVLTGSGPSLEAQQYGTADYGSNQFFFSYGTKLSRILKNRVGDNFSFGGSLKIFSQGFSGGAVSPSDGKNPLNNATGTGHDADLGFLWDVNNWASLGLVFQNFLPDSFGGNFVWQKDQVTEGIPMAIRTGGRFKIFGPTALRKSTDSRLDLSLDYEGSRLGRPVAWHVGLEYLPIDFLTLRTGIDQKPRATETGIGLDNNLTFGVGFLFKGFTFDYAYHQFGELSDNSTHFFSIGYRGVDKYKPRPKVMNEAQKKSVIPQPELALTPKLKTFPDVPQDYWAFKPIQYISTLGIMDGFDDREFKPTKEITRGDLAVILVKAKGFEVGKDIKNRFSDIPLLSFSSAYISLAVERKYINGYPDGTFKPDQRVTRAEMAAIMARFSGLYLKPKLKFAPFDDLPVEHWAAPAAAAAKESGLFEYLGGAGFGPDLFVTRAEVAEIISKTSFAKQLIEKLLSGE